VEKVDKHRKNKHVHARKAHFALGIFAKAPQAGQVKTRLCPPLTPAQAADFYRLSLDETITRTQECSCEPLLFYAGDEAFFAKTYPELPRRPQQGATLGERMANALAGLLDEGYAAAALIGSDSPDLPQALIDEAFITLQQTDVVIAPSDDGGYVLIGESRHHPELFREIPWSTSEVLPMTRERATRNNIAFQEIAAWEDIDDIYSLQRFVRRSPESRCAAWAKAFLRDNCGG
jgi:rSAM/selenodomain-associated transferase 1